MNNGKLFGIAIALYGVYAWYQNKPRFGVKMPDGTIQTFGSQSWLDPVTFGSMDIANAFLAGGIPVIVANGAIQQELTLTEYGGGYLINNTPLNVVFGQPWLPGQIEALNAAGLIPYYPLT